MNIFISYSSADQAVTAPLVQALREREAKGFFSEDTIRLGSFWTPVLEEELRKADAVVLLVGEQGPSPWQLMEYYAALDRKVKAPTFPIVPVLLGRETARFPFLQQLNWLALAGAPGGGTAARILDAITGDPGARAAPWKFLNPFRDLEALDERNADLFFGREAETNETIVTLAGQPDKIVVLVGNSGVGKSSLAKAGVMAVLRRQHLASRSGSWPSALKASREWLFLTMKPGEQPVEALVDAFIGQWNLDVLSPETAALRKRWTGFLHSGELNIRDLIDATYAKLKEKDQPLPTSIFLYVDQGEELYLAPYNAAGAPKTAEVFSAALSAGVGDPRLTVLMSLRSDHYGRLQGDRELFQKSVRIDVTPLRPDGLEAIMTNTAKALGVRFDTDQLPSRIAASTGSEPGAVALLSVFLADMWRAMQKRGDGVLSLVAQGETIDIGSARKDRAQLYFDEHQAQQEEIKRLFVPRLVRLPKDGPALRRRTDLADLSEPQRKIVDDLASGDWRLLVTSQDGPRPQAEVAHEVLFKTWSLLRGWIEGRRNFLEWKEEVENTRKQWEDRDKRWRDLLMGGALDRASTILDLNRNDIQPTEVDYIERSAWWSRLRFWAAAAAVLLVIAGLGAGIVTLEKANVDLAEAKDKAETAKVSAETSNKALELSNEKLAKANEENHRQIAEAQRRESLFLTKTAEAAIAKQDYSYATAIALESIPDLRRQIERPVVSAAYAALGEAFAGLLRQIGEAMRHEDSVNSAAFSPDGRRIVTASDDNTAQQWDAATGAPIGEAMQHDAAVLSAAFSPDGRRIVTASDKNTAQQWDAATGAPIGAAMKHEGAVWSAAFSPDSTRIVTASDDNTAQQWDAATGAPIGAAMEHEGAVWSAAFSPDGRRIVTASDDHTARQWNVATGALTYEVLQYENEVYFAAFSPDGRRIVTASDDHTARLWDAATGAPIGEAIRHEGPVNFAAFSPDGRRIVTASDDHTARLWDAATGAPIGEAIKHEGPVNFAAFSPDGRRIVTASDDHTARLWNAATGAPIGEAIRHEGAVWSAAFSPDGRRIVTASDDHTARLWDAATGRPTGDAIKHGGPVNFAAFSPDGRRIVTASDDHTARLWDAATGAPIGEAIKHGGPVNFAAFSPDGGRIVTASDDHTARLWDGPTGAPIGEAMKYKGAVWSAAFSPDGMRIVTASGETARIWRAYKDQQEFIDTVRSKLTRCLTAGERAALYLPPQLDIKINPRYCRNDTAARRQSDN